MRSTAAVAMLDIDHFKQVNDNYGHATGDLVIRHVATQLRRSLRGGDLVARLGGDEFAIFLVNTSFADAGMRLDVLRADLAQSEVVSAGRRINITVSIGIAMSPDDGAETQSLLAAADARLLIGKRAGRNLVVAS
jgi:diguanylate cyclase (GGDEF)-like protein